MPKLTFDANEIEKNGEAIVNSSGNIYISRKHKGMKAYWILLNKKKE